MSDTLRFTVYFDGTGNNKDLDTPKGAHTNVARLYEADQAKGTNLARNSGHEPRQYDVYDRSGQSEKVYFDGVGSHAEVSLRSLVEGGSGLGGQSRIDHAYYAIVAFHNKYPDQKVDVNIVGFSRGAAQSRALANDFIDKGVPKLDGQGKPTSEFLIPPGEAHVNKMGIFDTVASYGNAISDTHLGQNLEISKNVDSTTHLVAGNEYRDTFRLTSALRNDDNSRIEEITFAGAHSLVGGGYRNDVLAAAPLAYMYESMHAAGIELGPLPPKDIQQIENYNKLIESPEKIRQALIDSRLKQGNEAFTRNHNGSFQKVNNTPFAMERGFVNIFDRQSQPFEHETAGRGVVFENDDSLSRLKIVRVAENIGSRLSDLGQKALSRAARFTGKDDPDQALDETLDRVEQTRAQLGAVAREQGGALSGELKASRPTAEYIESLHLQPVPIPAGAKQGLHAVLQVQQRSDSFKDMEKKARSLNPSACVGEASQSGRKATSGMGEHHILKKVGQSDQFVIHDRRDIDASRTFQLGKCTAIVHEKRVEDLARTIAPKLEHDADSSSAVRR